MLIEGDLSERCGFGAMGLYNLQKSVALVDIRVIFFGELNSGIFVVLFKCKHESSGL